MFSGCSSLKVLNLSTFDMTSLLSVQGMLEECDGLETIYTPKAMLDGVYISLPHTFYDSEKNSVTSIAKNLCNSIIVKKWTNNTGFNTQRDGWCFVNHSIGFDYDENYRIPKERYEKVFGSRYVATATTNKKTYNSMMPEWDGNCYGMSATAILFYLDILDWSKYDDLYENDFSYVNSYFYTLRDLDGIGAYACSDYKTEITELIECYQIFQQGLGNENLYTSIVVDGVLDSSDTIALSLVEDSCVVTGDISGDSLLELYTDNETDTEEKLLMTLSESEDDVEILDVRDVIFTVRDAYLDKVYVDDNIVNLIDGTYTIFADNKKHTVKAIDKSGNEVRYTITVNREEIDYTVNGYSGIYDGQLHGITVNVEESETIKVTYSIDGETFSEMNPQFIDKGKYIVYYRIDRNTYNTVEGQEQVIIQGKDITIMAKDQYIIYGDNIDNTMYTVTGLVEGDSIKECSLASSTIEITENGTIEIDGAKIVNADDGDVTENYNISYRTGKLIIKDKIFTEYEILEGEILSPFTKHENIDASFLLVIVVLGMSIVCISLLKERQERKIN